MTRPAFRRRFSRSRTTRPMAALAAMLLGLVALTSPASADPPPAVVVSIKPLHALVAAVMRDVATPALIVSRAASPHDYALKPSDAEALEKARLVFWMGPELESFLVRPLHGLGPAAEAVPLGKRLGDRIRPTRLAPLHERAETGAHDAAEAEDHHGHAHEDERGHEHDHEEADHHADHEEAEAEAHDHGHAHIDAEGRPLPDLHAWLDPTIAADMVEIVASALERADPGHAAHYRRNADEMKRRLTELDGELAETLAPVRDRPFIVFHDAYQYFEARYRLNGIGALSISPETPPGARRLAALRAEIEAGGAVCVFSEPQFEPKLVHALVDGTAVRSASLDPLGVDLDAGPEAYFTLLRRMAATFKECLNI